VHPGSGRGAAQEKGVSLTSKLPEGLTEVTGDEQRLSLVLSNLLSNALWHTSQWGQIAVFAQRVDGKYVRIAVQGDGEGSTFAFSLRVSGKPEPV
jgi:cell cycle sensor histidine kinase DivJ